MRSGRGRGGAEVLRRFVSLTVGCWEVIWLGDLRLGPGRSSATKAGQCFFPSAPACKSTRRATSALMEIPNTEDAIVQNTVDAFRESLSSSPYPRRMSHFELR